VPLLRNLGIPEEGEDFQPLTRIFNLGNTYEGVKIKFLNVGDVNIKQE
jgi:hypothetical protein